jgi:2-polyprenyl-3-methyl-5-hydroxy-6-metoxy-1,4-benzoquinol methylase
MTCGYEQTSASGYFENERADVVAKLPRPLGGVLDVGCGAGGVGRSLRAAGVERIVGIEIHAPSAERARAILDEVHVGAVEQVLGQGLVQGPFDTFVLYDVLEHLVDPAAVLEALVPLAAPGARAHVSVPNARHWTLMRDLVLRGTFGYTDWGHRDRTHLRWFTRRDIAALVADAGWRVTGFSHPPLGRSRGLDRLTRGRSTEFLVGQWYVAARAR